MPWFGPEGWSRVPTFRPGVSHSSDRSDCSGLLSRRKLGRKRGPLMDKIAVDNIAALLDEYSSRQLLQASIAKVE